jgi:adenylosuccinate lyase
MEPADCISPLDGRYRKTTEPLAKRFSENALIAYRVRMEAEYLLALGALKGSPFKLSAGEQKKLRALREISSADAALVKKIETAGHAGIPATNHDVKAAEYFIRIRMKELGLEALSEWTHFALTSEDTNNIAYALMLSDALGCEIIPALEEVLAVLEKFAANHAADPLLARTHGQPAVPTTFGKEFKVFAVRLNRQIKQLKAFKVPAKLNGAVGNYNAHMAALPNADWLKFSKDFIAALNAERKIKLEANLFTTQIESHDGLAELCDCMRRVNTILTGFSQDIWRYISDGLIMQKTVAGEIGSSTMPQKVNPIDFENAEGNFGAANALFNYFATKLPISRLQRDLSDSTTQRSIGSAFAYSVVGYRALLRGLGKIHVNREAALAMLSASPEVLAEGLQTILRREGVPGGYEKLKAVTRGQKPSMEMLTQFIDTLPVKPQVKAEMKKLRPENYTGLAAKIAKLKY